MIPRQIHYCWFGGREKGPEILGYIDTWKKMLPDYQIREWNENNFDLNCCRYVQEAYAAGKYAFVSDYVRLYALFTEGGLYFDTDIEVRRDFSRLLENRKMVLGFEDDRHVMTGFMAAEPRLACFGELLERYHAKRFILENGRADTLPNPVIVTEVMKAHGLQANGARQRFGDGFEIFPADVFSAYDIAYQRLKITPGTVAVHHCMGTWQTGRERFRPKLKSILLRIFGERAFNWCKAKFYQKKDETQ